MIIFEKKKKIRENVCVCVCGRAIDDENGLAVGKSVMLTIEAMATVAK